MPTPTSEDKTGLWKRVSQANTLKASGSASIALQLTTTARKAGFVDDERVDGDLTVYSRASFWTRVFEDLIILANSDECSLRDLNALQAEINGGKAGQFRVGSKGKVTKSGNGYQVPLAGATHAGMEVGDRPYVWRGTRDPHGLIVLSKRDQTRLIGDLFTLRTTQLE